MGMAVPMSGGTFAVAIDRTDPIVVMTTSGEMDASTVGRLEACVDTAIREHEAHVVLDASAVTFVDSTGITALVSSLRRLNRSRRRLGAGRPGRRPAVPRARGHRPRPHLRVLPVARRGGRRPRGRPADRPLVSNRGRWRPRLRSACARLPCSRRSFDARVGRVLARGRRTRSALASRASSRSSASSRLRAWDRASWAIARTTGPQRATTRRRCSSVSEDAATSKIASMREAVTLAC